MNDDDSDNHDDQDGGRLSPATRAIEACLRAIPSGKVSTYGAVARAAGLANGARQVVRVLHSRAAVSGLPWHRVLAKGRAEGTARIALTGSGADEQRALLRSEGVEVSAEGTVDLARFGYMSDC
ncbi:MAG TPA: MGMT family protein [Treponemataceae bacterium]|nr:MGMT family protein [Treponemataceae bacterium]HPS45080.1 MGMT family protein [Treponemataceae bacterium]